VPAAPLIVALLVSTVTVTGSVLLAFQPDPFTPGAALLFSGGMVLTTVAAAAGILLARGRWAGRVGAAVGAGWVVVGAAHPAWSGAALAGLGGLAVAAALGPWMTNWLRRLPTAGGVPPVAVGLLLTLLLTPAAAAAATPDEVHPAIWLLSGGALLVALLVARIVPGSRLLIRFGYPAAALVAAWFAGWPVGAVAVASAVIVAVLGWQRGLGFTLTVPAGMVHRLPPELAPAAVLDAAGADESGRLRENP
jgi:hypothetical protein